jgi:hypothetical protein
MGDGQWGVLSSGGELKLPHRAAQAFRPSLRAYCNERTDRYFYNTSSRLGIAEQYSEYIVYAAHGIMSYYFAIVGTQDNPLFEHEFGTSKQGGDGQSRFSDQVRHLNQFILHSSLDIAEEVQWSHGQM